MDRIRSQPVSGSDDRTRHWLSGYQLFFAALPLRFYCLLTLVFVLLSAYLCRDYGPMLKAERRAQTTGQVIRPGCRADDGSGTG